MIITEQKPLGEIIDSLKNHRKIFLVGCGDCSATCKTGGEPEVLRMKELLEAEGKIIVAYVIPDAPCVASKVKTVFAQHAAALREAEAILVLACGLGVQSVKDNDRTAKPAIPACNSLCGALLTGEGKFLQKCVMCGSCVLADTGGICPVTLCPKGLMNGPCGGTDKGKCEVDKTRDCAWVLIYNEMEKRNTVERMKKISLARDHQKAAHPHALKVKE